MLSCCYSIFFDHSLLITLHNKLNFKLSHFIFKNYWTCSVSFCNIVQDAWRVFFSSDPLFVLAKKLISIKAALKVMHHNSSSLTSLIIQAKADQPRILSSLNDCLDDLALIHDSREICDIYNALIK